jgi:Protein of unknown function (DUF2802)
VSASNWTLLEIGGLTLGLREIVIGLIVLVALYMALVVWRMRGLQDSADGHVDKPEPVIDLLVDDLPEPDEPLPERLREPLQAVPPVTSSVDVARLTGLEQDALLLRDEVDALRAELAALRADIQRELAVLRAAQTISPVYGDAMQLAISGYDADRIAERCGIARAEAELVVALARSREEDAK